MTPDERRAALALASCRFAPATWDKKFSRDMGERARAETSLGYDAALSPKQRANLWRLCRRYRVQLGANGFADVAEAARRMILTEQEWLGSTDPAAMLDYLNSGRVDESAGANYPLQPCRINPSDRKRRLFACACCRVAVPRKEGHWTDDQWERFLIATGEVEQQIEDGEYRGTAFHHPDWSALILAQWASKEATPAKAALLRDVFGNPFHPVTLTGSDTWMIASVVQLGAETIYQERSFEKLPILADALEDAGCTDAVVLQHCRRDGQHVRGCWVVDLLLGKE